MKRSKSERGAALLEAAITIPMLLLVSVGIFEFGRAYQTWQVLTNAAREGARLAVLPDPTPGVAEDRVLQYMQAGQLTAATSATIAVNLSTPSSRRRSRAISGAFNPRTAAGRFFMPAAPTSARASRRISRSR